MALDYVCAETQSSSKRSKTSPAAPAPLSLVSPATWLHTFGQFAGGGILTKSSSGQVCNCKALRGSVRPAYGFLQMYTPPCRTRLYPLSQTPQEA